MIDVLTTEPSRGRTLAAASRRHLRTVAPPLVLIVLLVAIGSREPLFFSLRSQETVVNEAIPILLLALGQMFVLLIGGIDLSNAATASLLGVFLADWLPSMGVGAVVLVIACGLVAGAVNGLVCSYGQVPSFVATLGTLALFQAVALVISHGSAITITSRYGVISWLADGTFGGIAPGFVIGLVAIGLTAVGFAVLRRGMVFHTVGLSEQAAIVSGVSSRLVRLVAFVLSGLFSALAALYLTASQGSGAPGLADSLLLPAIAAAVIGGIAITGGVGSPIGVLFGALIMSVLRVGTTIAGISPTYQDIIYGVAVIVAVVATIDRRRLATIK